MVVKISGCWELAWNTPIKEKDLWMLLRDFGVDEWCMSPISGIDHGKVTEYRDHTEAIKKNPKLKVIYVDEAGEKPLSSFRHPKNCLYVFGRASMSPWVADGKPEKCSIRIDTPKNKALLWPHQAASIVLYDRFMKSK